MKRKHTLSFALLVLFGLAVPFSTVIAENGLAISPQSTQQSIKVSGSVVDAKGEPVIGASVLVKGTTNGSITNLDGEFSLNAASGSTLIVTFVGYKPQEVKATNVMKVILQEDTELLDEVVVVGYGMQKKVNLTGAVSTVDVGKSLEGRPISDIGRALQGAVPGLTITTKSGEIGGAPIIKIRGGVGSPNGSSNPLILVDNVEISDISLVNPDDIESISVLKDAASSSIYGARAAFGVILITTKAKQRAEKVTVKYSANFAWRTPTRTPEQLPGWQQGDINLKGMKAAVTPAQSYTLAGNIVVNDKTVKGMKDFYDKYGNGKSLGLEMQEGRDFEIDNAGIHFYRTWDWYDMYVKQWMPQQNHNLSVNGGNGRTNYGVTLGYLGQEGLTKVNPDTYKRYNANLTLNTEINKYISIRGNAMYTRTNTEKPFLYNSNELYDQMYYLYRWQSMYPYGTFEGKPFRSSVTDVQQAHMTRKERDYTRLSGGITIKPIKGLTVDVDFYYTTTEARYKKYGDKVMGYDIFSTLATKNVDGFRGLYKNYATPATFDYVYEERERTEMMTNNIVATYVKKFGQHDFKFMAGSNIEQNEYKYIWAQAKGLLDIAKPELNLTKGEQTNGSAHNDWAVAGFFGRINYAFMDRYLLEVNGRYDGSSLFPRDQRFAFFPSVSMGYRITEEEFMKPLAPILSSLKLRGSYGTIGNQDVGLNKFVSTLNAQVDSWVIDGIKQKSVSTPTIVSRELTWETVKTIDFGFDARFLDEKLGVTFDWYKRTTSDVLASQNLPLVLGVASPSENMGELETRGWEVSADYRHTFKNGLSINVGGQLTDYQTKVTKWTNNTLMPSYSTTGVGWYGTPGFYKKGMVLGDIWGLQVDRMLQQSDFDASGNLVAGLPDQKAVFPSGYKLAPGDILYKDLNHDDKITQGPSTTDPGDYGVIGNMMPRFEYGFSLGAEYKGVDFSVFFQGVGKRALWAMGNQVLPGFTAGEPYYKGAEDYWSPENTNAFYPRPMNYAQLATGNYTVNDRYLLNLAYLRCKTLTVGYSFPKAWIKKAMIQNLRVYFTGENLFEFDNMKVDIDPEIDIRNTTTSGDPRNYGRSYPYQRTISFGLQVTL